MNRMTQLVSVPSLTIAVALGAVLGQRAVAPDAAVIATVKINELFDELQQRADSRIDLRRL